MGAAARSHFRQRLLFGEIAGRAATPAGRLSEAKVALFTLNRWHHVIYPTLVNKYVFVMDEELDEDPGDEFFALGNPLMQWSLADCSHPQFPGWAYSILKPAIEVETANQQYGPMWRFTGLVGGPYEFKDRDSQGLAVNLPIKSTP